MDSESASELENGHVIKYEMSEGRNIIYFAIKRFFDVVLSLAGLIIAFPFLLLLGIAIKLESKGPVIYRQERVGKDYKIFTIYKIRSMFVNAESDGIKWAKKNDERVTSIGRFIRRTRIDEIPQLVNILRNEMSIVGPRPERPGLTQKFNGEIPRFTDRLKVKPGLTGLAQVNGGYDITPQEKLKLDLLYMENMSIILDLNIILKTIIVVFTGHGAR